MFAVTRFAARYLSCAVVAIFFCAPTMMVSGALAAPIAGASIEQHVAPTAAPSGGAITAPLPQLSTNNKPLGVDLNGIRLIGPRDNVAARATGAGVVIENIGAMSHDALRAVLLPFLGKPVSQQSMSEIQAAIAKVYRAAQYPFLSVTYPPQDISGGVLQLRVVEFHVGKVDVKGAPPVEQKKIQESVRLTPGGRINSAELSEDVRWLNLYPYRFIQTYFTPGDALGASNFDLKITESKPWQVFGGVSNDGAPSSQLGRTFLGFGAGISALDDLIISYQLTTSTNFWSDFSLIPSGPNAPSYVSHSAVFQLPLAPRMSLEFAPSYSAVRQTTSGSLFSFDTNIVDLPFLYRSAVSNIVPGLYAGDFLLGIEPKAEKRVTYFGGVEAASGLGEVFDLVAGWQDTAQDSWGHTDFDVRVIGNPGGVLQENSQAAWDSFTNGRVTTNRYIYGSFNINRVTSLPLGMNWVTHIVANAAGQALPDTEEFALGGLNYVRGYTYDDSTVDSGVVVRDELRLPVTSPLSSIHILPVSDTFSPYGFVDYGTGRLYGSALVPARDFELASVGAGFEYQIGRYLHATLNVANALHDALVVHAGDWAVQGQLTLTY